MSDAVSSGQPVGADHADLVRALTDALGRGSVVPEPDIMRGFASDHARFCPAGTPAALVRATSTAEVSLRATTFTDNLVGQPGDDAAAGHGGAVAVWPHARP